MEKKHSEPYNDQYIFLCEAANHGEIAIQQNSEVGMMNRLEANIHQPEWVGLSSFPKLQFSTMKLQNAIINSLENGFPEKPILL